MEQRLTIRQRRDDDEEETRQLEAFVDNRSPPSEIRFDKRESPTLCWGMSLPQLKGKEQVLPRGSL